MLFAAAKLNQKLTESPKFRCHLLIWALKGQFVQVIHTPATCNVRIQALVSAFQCQYSREFSLKLEWHWKLISVKWMKHRISPSYCHPIDKV